MFSAMKSKVMNGCWVHCYTLDFLTAQGVLICKFAWQIMKALIFVLVTSTLPPFSLPSGVLGSSVTFFPSSSPKMPENSPCCFKFTRRCIWKRGQFGACYIMTFHCRLSEKYSGTRKDLHHHTMQKCTILASSIDLAWCNSNGCAKMLKANG